MNEKMIEELVDLLNEKVLRLSNAYDRVCKENRRRPRAAHQPQRRTARPAQQPRRQQERRPHHKIHQKKHIEIDDRPHKPHPLFLG